MFYFSGQDCLMDNVTHTFYGWLLARAGLDRFGPWAAPVLVAASNLPDVDSVLRHPWSDKVAYLNSHRGLSHTLSGAGVAALALTLAVWLAGRALRKSLHEPPRFFPVLMLSLVGVLSHLLLDWMNTYGVRFLMPFDERWFYGDMAFVVDPWMWLILGGAVFLGTRASRRTRVVWALLTLIGSTVMFMAARATWVPWGVPTVWMLALLSLVFFRAKIFSAQPSRIPAQAGLLLWTIYVCALFAASRISTSRALEAFYSNRPEDRARIHLTYSATPAPGIPWRYQVLVQTNKTLDLYTVNLAKNSLEHKPLTANLDDPLLKKIEETGKYTAWRRFARHPICERRGDLLVLGDMRYRLNPHGDWSELTIRILKQDAP
jgi:inner membrane protein